MWLEPDAEAHGCYEQINFRRRTARSSADLRDAILRTMGQTTIRLPGPKYRVPHKERPTGKPAFVYRSCDKVARIQRIVAEFYDIDPDVMTSRARGSADESKARHVACYLSREIVGRSLIHLGNLFGKRDHTTILHGIREVERRIAEEPTLAAELAEIRDRVGALAG